MSKQEYNPNDDEYLNKLKKIKSKEKQLVKYNEAIDKASEEVPLSKIKEQAKELTKAKQKKIIIIISTVLLVIVFTILCIFFCFSENGKTQSEQEILKSDTTTEEDAIIKSKPEKTLDINVVYFSKTDFNADINKRLTSYLDSLKTADSIDIFKLHIINSGEVIKSDNVYEVANKLLSEYNFKVGTAEILSLFNKINLKHIIFMGQLDKLARDKKTKNIFKNFDYETLRTSDYIIIENSKINKMLDKKIKGNIK